MDMIPGLQPSVSKACSRCHARKVKCDLQVPRCAACIRQNDECNITERVYYSYSSVRTLQDQINELQAKLGTASNAVNQTSIADQVGIGEHDALPQIDVRLGERLLDNRNAEQSNLNKEAEEVGVLAIGGPNHYSGGNYVGSAAGSTFARIFFKQLNLIPSWVSGRQGGSLEQCPSQRQAALPPLPIATSLMTIFISQIHIWWPFLRLPDLRRICQRIYQDPQQCCDQEKFLIFIVLALASSRISKADDHTPAKKDMNDAHAYFQTAIRFFNHFHDHPRDLFGIQAVLLLGIWMLDSASSSHSNDLWQLSRYVMSAAIEAGLHRHNNNWGFTSEELEIRNRTWWSAYNLERQVATITGRVLSIRDHAIHALLPKPCDLDNLSPRESLGAPTFSKHNVSPFLHMIALRRIGGSILESIYIARGPDGKAMDTSFQQICTRSDEIRRDLEQWKQQLDEMGLKPSPEYSEMKLEYCLLLLLLYRPSPTFMVPSRQMILVCSKAASGAIAQLSKLEAQGGISAVCRCFRQLHDILVIGLAALYCDWQVTAASQSTDRAAPRLYRHINEINICLDLIDRGISYMKAPYLSQYQDLLLAVRNKVYADTILNDVSPSEIRSQQSMPSTQNTYDASTGLGFDNMAYSTGDGVESYMDQVNEFLDSGTFDVDETLSAWYDTLVEEMQEMQESRAVDAF